VAKKIDPKAKAKRQKIFAAVGGVILLGVLAFQVPRTMKMLNQSSGTSSSSSSTPAATTPATPSPIAAPSLSGGNATATATGGDGLTDPDAVPTPQSGQLLAFGLFRSKDPFVQQLRAGASGASGATGEPGPTGASGPTGAGGLTGGGVPPSGGSSPATPAPAVTTAVISVDGTPETVKVGAQFPAASPVFTLLSLTKTAAKISIAGGSLENGAPAVTLTKKKPLTLLNTADGTRYVLRLISVS
jgi:hypothetical protein